MFLRLSPLFHWSIRKRQRLRPLVPLPLMLSYLLPSVFLSLLCSCSPSMSQAAKASGTHAFLSLWTHVQSPLSKPPLLQMLRSGFIAPFRSHPCSWRWINWFSLRTTFSDFSRILLGQTSSTSSSSSLPDQLPIAHHGRASVSSSSKHFLTHILKLSLEFQCNSIETRCFSTIILTYSHKVVDFLTLFQPDYKTPQVNNSVFIIKIKEGNGIMERIKKTRLERWLRVHTRCRSYKGP